MKKNFLFLLILGAIALVTFGCSISTSSQSNETKTTPSPSPTATPKKELGDYQVNTYRKSYEKLVAFKSETLDQIATTTETSKALCTAHDNYIEAIQLEKAANATSGKELEDFMTKAQAKELADRHLIAFGSFMNKVFKSNQGYLSCAGYRDVDRGSDTKVITLERPDLFFRFIEEMNGRNIPVTKAGIAPENVKAIALQQSKIQAKEVFEWFAEPDDAADSDGLTNAQHARLAWKQFRNPWGFAYYELGISDKDFQKLMAVELPDEKE